MIDMTGYYDYVLGLIPLVLGGLTALLLAGGFSLSTAVPVAALPAVGLMGHAMFVRSPIDTVPEAPRAGDGAGPAN